MVMVVVVVVCVVVGWGLGGWVLTTRHSSRLLTQFWLAHTAQMLWRQEWAWLHAKLTVLARPTMLATYSSPRCCQHQCLTETNLAEILCCTCSGTIKHCWWMLSKWLHLHPHLPEDSRKQTTAAHVPINFLCAFHANENSSVRFLCFRGCVTGASIEQARTSSLRWQTITMIS